MSDTRLRIRTATVVATVTAMLFTALVAVAMVAVAPAASAAPAPIAERTSASVTADVLPTVQINGVVWSQAVVNNIVYAGGSFTAATPAGVALGGAGTVTRNNLLAYDITTGDLITSFAPDLNAQVQAVASSPDGSTIYVGGSFTTADGANRYRMAAYSTATGQLITTFAPNLNATVNAIAATNSTVYVGGNFTSANGQPRSYLAAFNASDGSLTGWAPTADNTVSALVVTPDGTEVIAGGHFANVNSSASPGVAAINATTGVLYPYAVNKVVQDSGSGAAILDLTTDGAAVYGNGYNFSGAGNLEGAFSVSPDTGAINWIEDCHGDTYANFPVNGLVYTVGHAHFCGNVGGFPDTVPRNFHRALEWTAEATGTLLHNTTGSYKDYGGEPSPTQVNWYPDLAVGTYTGQDQAAWSVSGNSDYITLGGEFPSVNGIAQAGLVRFAVPPIAPSKQGPMLSGTDFVPTLVAPSNSSVRLTWQANWDRDDENLTYEVIRNGAIGSPVYTTTVTSQFWNLPLIEYLDTGLTPGATYQYRIFALDPDGNVAKGDTVSITVPVTNPGPPDTYGQAVYVDGPSLYWRLDEASGPTAVDASPNNSNGVYSSTGVTYQVPSPVTVNGTAVTFNGSTGSIGSVKTSVNPTVYSEELWFDTTTKLGGKLIGFGNLQSGLSSKYDRQVYMLPSGQLVFGTYTTARNTATSPAAYNDGRWHYLVAEQGPGGMSLWVDGQKVATNPQTGAQNYTGYWRVGGDKSWAGANYFAGSIDEVAVYPVALTSAQIQAHYTASPASQAQPPVASFTSSCTGLSCTFTSTSTDPSGTIDGWSWGFGDPAGGTSTASSPSYQYASAGTYPVSLTVSDSGTGKSGSTTQQVSVGQAPADKYAPAVLASAPSLYWRVNEASGPTAVDASPNNSNGVYSSTGVTYQVPSPVTVNGTAVTFNGSTGSIGSVKTSVNPTVYSEELWFDTTTKLGGKLIGFGNLQSGLSSKYDRQVYMLPSGQLVFGTYTTARNTATSPAAYNDGRWHYLVAEQGPGGMSLWVDGQKVATNPQTGAQNYTGYWRVGGDKSWAGANYFAGSIDEVAVYPVALTSAQIQAHYTASPVG